MSAKRKPTQVATPTKAVSIPQRRISLKQLFSVATIGLLLAAIAALVGFLSFQQDRRTAESSSKASATQDARVGQQTELLQQLVTAQAFGPLTGPTATAMAESIAIRSHPRCT